MILAHRIGKWSLTWLLAAVVPLGCDGPAKSNAVLVLSPAEMLTEGVDEGFERATVPRPFEFPEDHGPHPGFRTEWWYVTGNLRDELGEPLGFQFTVFRSALSPSPPLADSPWSTNQMYMAHLAVTDSASGTHRSSERFARGAVGLAGARASPFRVWLEDWELRADSSAQILPMVLRGADDGLAVDLRLAPGKPLVLHGDRGLSTKSADPGSASYYYSFTRLPVTGIVELAGRRRRVTGQAWMDREWSTSVLSPDQTGWDWLSLQLEDGRDIMVFRLRTDTDEATSVAGTLVEVDGTSRPLEAGDVDMREARRWTSPDDLATYPVEWDLRIPKEDLHVRVTPILDDQEVHHAFRYWEGAVRATSMDGEGVVGSGYLEMTGYVRPPSR